MVEKGPEWEFSSDEENTSSREKTAHESPTTGSENSDVPPPAEGEGASVFLSEERAPGEQAPEAPLPAEEKPKKTEAPAFTGEEKQPAEVETAEAASGPAEADPLAEEGWSVLDEEEMDGLSEATEEIFPEALEASQEADKEAVLEEHEPQAQEPEAPVEAASTPPQKTLEDPADEKKPEEMEAPVVETAADHPAHGASEQLSENEDEKTDTPAPTADEQPAHDFSDTFDEASAKSSEERGLEDGLEDLSPPTAGGDELGAELGDGLNALDEASLDEDTEDLKAALRSDSVWESSKDEGDLGEEGGVSDLVLKRDVERRSQIVEQDEEEGTTRERLDRFYQNIMETLEKSEDLGLTPAAADKIREALGSEQMPQLSVKELLSKRVIGRIQLARAVARSQNRREIMSFLDIPQEAVILRKELDPKVTAYLRENRIIPLWRRTTNEGYDELHLAHEEGFRDLVKEAVLAQYLPEHKYFWHFALREVCGAFWLAGDTSEDVDVSMEAEALLDRIITNAIDARSSDIHIDPSIKGEPRAIVKYRIDGFVTPKEVVTIEQLERLKIRIENVSRMPKVNQNHPNKGAFTRAGFDWRVQIQPHAGRQGPVPRIVIRRLQPDVMPMEALGYPQYFIDDIQAAAKAPNGVIFWTGPTGSGKTESIHSAVVSVNPMGKGLSVHTIEDPPEKRVSGYAVQMEIAEGDPARSGMELLKSSLRADPDVVIFGEVRDGTMAKLVFEAANTGHLVFSTLHTNTSLDAIVRLDEIGIYGFLVSYIRGIAAQRLVRRLCTHCKKPMEEVDGFTKSVFEKYDIPMEGATLYQSSSEGCASCNHTGYHGRIAICEWLTPNKELVDASTRRDYTDLERIAVAAGWKPMGYMGVLHVKNGITDAKELATKVLELSSEVVD